LEKILVRSFLQSDWSRIAQGLEDHHLEIETGESGLAVWADPKLLRMALGQFLDNASKYAEPESDILLRVAVTDAETVFSVHNSGSYIPPQEREQIFHRFYRSPESRYRAPGTGIGLTVSRQIAEAHRGQIWIESDMQTGTTFFLGLPHIIRESK
jgi:two-component system sensor histidine kinase KdpD